MFQILTLYKGVISKASSKKSTLVIEARPEELLFSPEVKEKTTLKITGGLKELKTGKKPSSQFWQIDDCDDSSGSNVKCMYRKKDVYLGVKECSFEELKALKWLRDEERKKQIKKVAVNMVTPKQRL